MVVSSTYIRVDEIKNTIVPHENDMPVLTAMTVNDRAPCTRTHACATDQSTRSAVIRLLP
jgi:hypothetical protein